MTVSIQDQLRDYAAEVTSQSVPVDLDEIAFGDPPSQPVTQTVGAWPETPTEPMVPTRPRSWLVGLVAATAVLVLLGGLAWLSQVTDLGTPVADPVVASTLTESTPTTVAAPDLADLPGCVAASTWSRVCDEAAGFDGAAMWSVTAGGPGLVAVGGDFHVWTPEDLVVPAEGGSGDAVVWTSPDGVSWSRVPLDKAVFGGDGEQQMFSVIAGGPGLVAVGIDGTVGNREGNAAVWTSPDGFTWTRVPHDEAIFGGENWQAMFSVTVGGLGLVAVGTDGTLGLEGNAAVWTSPDGFTWTRVRHDESVFGEGGMASVTVGGPGLVAVGTDWTLDVEDDRRIDESAADAAVWTSPDGFTWSRVPHNEAVFGGSGQQKMLDVTVGGPGLVAVGKGKGAAAVWTSPDGFTWSRVPHDRTVFGAWDCGDVCDGSEGPTSDENMLSVTVGGPGLVAVGWTGFDQVGWDEAVWTSPDGVTWTRLPQARDPHPGYDRMFSVTVTGSGLVAVGEEHGDGSVVAAVWED